MIRQSVAMHTEHGHPSSTTLEYFDVSILREAVNGGVLRSRVVTIAGIEGVKAIAILWPFACKCSVGVSALYK